MSQPKALATLTRSAAAALLVLGCAAWAQEGGAPAPASAASSTDGLRPGEVHALYGYVLSMDKLQKYAMATNELKKAVHDSPDLALEVKQMAGEPEETLADLRSRLARHPIVLGFFTRQGLSSDDVLLLPMTLMGASLAGSIKDPTKYPPTINPEQVKFVAAHKDEIDKLHLVSEDEDDWGN
jgi:hypothetical protein